MSGILSFLNASFQKYIYPHCYAGVYSDCIFSLSEFVMVVKYFLFFSSYGVMSYKGSTVFPEGIQFIIFHSNGCVIWLFWLLSPFQLYRVPIFQFYFSDFTSSTIYQNFCADFNCQ